MIFLSHQVQGTPQPVHLSTHTGSSYSTTYSNISLPVLAGDRDMYQAPSDVLMLMLLIVPNGAAGRFLLCLGLTCLENHCPKKSSVSDCRLSLPASRLRLTQPIPHPQTRQTTNAAYVKMCLLARKMMHQPRSSSTTASMRFTRSAWSSGWTGCSETEVHCTKLLAPTAAAWSSLAKFLHRLGELETQICRVDPESLALDGLLVCCRPVRIKMLSYSMIRYLVTAIWITMKAFPENQSGRYRAVIHVLFLRRQHEHHLGTFLKTTSTVLA
jgi:hypothetical protein